MGITLTDRQVLAGATPAAPPTDLSHVMLAVENLNCGGCMRRIERKLSGVDGVAAVRTNLSAKRVAVSVAPGGPGVETLIAELAQEGFRAAELAHHDTTAKNCADRDLLRRLAVAGFATANIMLLSVSVWAGIASDMGPETKTLFHWLSALIAVPAVAYAGQPFFSSALSALSVRRLNMDVPISLGVLLAAGMSLWQTVRGTDHVFFDASVSLVFFLLIGRYLDQSLRSRASGAAENLLGLKAGFATVLGADGAGERLPARMIEPGMRVLVAAGERIAVDGRIVSGTSDIDEQLMTGETVPRTVSVGDNVYAGTIALTAPIEVVATKADDDTLLSEIARLMAAAEQSRSRYVRLADRAARIYAPLVHILGMVTFLGWMALGSGVETALLAAIAVLIITCPCALALAVPAVQVAATSRLFSHGVIVTAADGLERMAEVDTLVLDKTGTLTRGEPTLTNGADIADVDLAAAAALAVNSRHPYSLAVVRAAGARGLVFSPAAGVAETPGAGLSRDAGSGTGERLGSAEWCGVDASRDTIVAGAAADDGASTLWYRAAPDAPAIAFRFEDGLRADAAKAVAAARAGGLEVLLLSGDRTRTVASAAAAAGIAEWKARLKPDDKIAELARLKAAGRRVLMVGDGLNDAPALAAAHASLAMAEAAAISQIAADGVVQGQLLAPVIDTLAMARRARRMSLANFAIAITYNVIFVPVAMAGLVTPLIAAIAMSASSIAVTANALRLRTVTLRLEQ
ncbi:MAG: heavy metal translocating P-type ATPase [Hyphomicrobiaceae bacterium]